MKISDHCITVSKSLISIDRELKIGEPVTITIEGEVDKDSLQNNHDGTFIRVYTIKGAIADIKAQGTVINDGIDVGI